MEQSYWLEWERFLSRWGLKTTANVLMKEARPLFPLLSQLMVLGLPIFSSLSMGKQYSALLNTLSDEEQVQQFSIFLEGER